MKEKHSKAQERLYTALMSVRSKEECASLLRDLCTEGEIEAMSERFAAAERVATQEPYRKIATELGLSLTTVARVAHWFYNGTGGYQRIISRINTTAKV